RLDEEAGGAGSPLAVPFVGPYHGHAMHLAVGEPFRTRGMPLFVPIDRLLARLDALFQAVPLWQAVLPLEVQEELRVVPFVTIVPERHFRRVETQLVRHVAENCVDAIRVRELLAPHRIDRALVHYARDVLLQKVRYPRVLDEMANPHVWLRRLWAVAEDTLYGHRGDRAVLLHPYPEMVDRNIHGTAI